MARLTRREKGKEHQDSARQTNTGGKIVFLTHGNIETKIRVRLEREDLENGRSTGRYRDRLREGVRGGGKRD